jgi:hypothetical protein
MRGLGLVSTTAAGLALGRDPVVPCARLSVFAVNPQPSLPSARLTVPL